MTKTIKSRIITGVILLILLMFSLCGIVSADQTSKDTAYTQITVTRIDIDPEIFVKGDTGIITISIKNSGTEPVLIYRAKLYSKDLSIQNNEAYDTVTPIGGGNEMRFSFTIEASCPDGIYYPWFYLDFGASSYSNYFPVRVESTDLSISVLNSPDSWQDGNEDEVILVIGNPRENRVNGVEIKPSRDGISSTQTSYFIGDLESDESAEVTFKITPENVKSIEFDVSWRNGVNKHTSTISIPIEYGSNKKDPNPIMNNVESSKTGSYYTISGDITNAGLEDANSVTVTTDSPATPVNPYKVYVVGLLEPDDFSSFEVTFTISENANSGTIPVIIAYKDNDGNDYQREYEVSLNSGSSSDASGSETVGIGVDFYGIPIFEIIIVIVVGCIIIIAWRKGYVKKGTEALRNFSRKKQ